MIGSLLAAALMLSQTAPGKAPELADIAPEPKAAPSAGQTPEPSDAPDAAPLIWLLCTYTYIYDAVTTDYRYEAQKSKFFRIDPDAKEVRPYNAEDATLGDTYTLEITPDKYTYAIGMEVHGVSRKGTIYRRTGEYFEAVRIKGSDGSATRNGTCAKAEPQEIAPVLF